MNSTTQGKATVSAGPGHGNKARRRLMIVRKAWLQLRLSEFKRQVSLPRTAERPADDAT